MNLATPAPDEIDDKAPIRVPRHHKTWRRK